MIVVITFILLLLLILLVGVIVHLVRRVRLLSKMRYGFGGKPLFSTLIVLGVAIAIPLTLAASYRSVEFINYARAERDVLMEVSEIKLYDDVYRVSFMAFPTLDDEIWGGKTYTITWQIKGDIAFEKVEKNRSEGKPSYFVKELSSGDYTVIVIVESEDFRVRKEQVLHLE